MPSLLDAAGHVQGGARPGRPARSTLVSLKPARILYHWASGSGGQLRCETHARPSLAGTRGAVAQVPRVGQNPTGCGMTGALQSITRASHCGNLLREPLDAGETLRVHSLVQENEPAGAPPLTLSPLDCGSFRRTEVGSNSPAGDCQRGTATAT